MKQKIIIGVVCVVLLIGLVIGVGSWWQSSNAASALEAKNPTPAQIKAIASLLADQSGRYRGRAEAKLREVGPPAVPALTELSRHVGEPVRVTAAKLAAEIDPEGNGLDGLAILLKADDSKVRGLAVGILSRFAATEEMGKYPRIGQMIISAVDDPDAHVRAAVADGLSHVYTKEAGDALKKLTKDADEEVAMHGRNRLVNWKEKMKRKR